jgi:hypothetical protein
MMSSHAQHLVEDGSGLVGTQQEALAEGALFYRSECFLAGLSLQREHGSVSCASPDGWFLGFGGFAAGGLAACITLTGRQAATVIGEKADQFVNSIEVRAVVNEPAFFTRRNQSRIR